MLGSAGWFTAMTLENAAHVRALGQVELVFTFIASWFFFRERSTGLEIGGVLLIVAGILILLARLRNGPPGDGAPRGGSAGPYPIVHSPRQHRVRAPQCAGRALGGVGIDPSRRKALCFLLPSAHHFVIAARDA